MFDQLSYVQNLLFVVTFFVSFLSTVVVAASLPNVRYLSGHLVDTLLNEPKRRGKLCFLCIFYQELDLVNHLIDEGNFVWLISNLQSFLKKK
jgi:hypothetical protein